ncbi:cytochrome c biogenesis protein CcsA [Micromonospora sp. WMMD1082]|uniref:cytochrome c biogenesis protein CcsA n=1 Tax=Micromonospora sp. WMMD1082 TaxID=3016104 RepID=UPI00241637AE|nr:cytochrome c biogenesis protein CcsA [Micromonospora sp. WMMD1082]MDG4798225.1 cytochrome c biogenesis protein CcsA [Micromonospora sp. WMMD1082]
MTQLHRILGLGAVCAAATAIVLAATAPPDAVQGEAQRLMYVHVPAAWTAYLAFTGVLVASAAYLRTGRRRWDRWATACAELGVGMMALAIALGSIWGRVTWGIWWTWDARLVSAAGLLLVYLGYLSARELGSDPDRIARRAAVLGILAFVMVPVVHFSVFWWRTLHQSPTLLGPDPRPPIAASMAVTLAGAVLAFTLAGAWVVTRRVARLAEAVARPPAPDRTAPLAEPAQPPAVRTGPPPADQRTEVPA